MSIALVPMSAKPYQKGHHNLVQTAAAENELVHLYVSVSDRDIVRGSDMQTIWKSYLEGILPTNVDVTYGGSPVRNIYKELGQAQNEGNTEIFTIYVGGADDEDASEIKEKFADHLMEKYFPEMLAAGQIRFKTVSRGGTGGISGTKMREFIKSADNKSFKANLPGELTEDEKQAIWELLVTSSASPVAPKARAKRGKSNEEFIQNILSRSSLFD
jgi:citrate lyase synthetase